MRRTFFLLLFLAVACKGADGAIGPEGPQGPAGPQGPSGAGRDAIILSGTLDETGSVSRDLPASAGGAGAPPTLSCYVGTGDPPAWLSITTPSFEDEPLCGLVFDAGVWNIVLVDAPPGFLYAFVAIPSAGP
jgi:hypothetical protein